MISCIKHKQCLTAMQLLYNEVMKLGLNGEERKKYLGNRYQEVQDYINKRH